MTQGWNPDADLFRGFKNRCAHRDLDVLSVNRNRNISAYPFATCLNTMGPLADWGASLVIKLIYVRHDFRILFQKAYQKPVTAPFPSIRCENA